MTAIRIISVTEADSQVITALVQSTLTAGGTKLSFYEYTLTPAASTASASELNNAAWTAYAAKPTNPSDLTIGGPNLFYDSNTKTISYFTTSYQSFALTDIGTATDTVAAYRLDNGVSVLSSIASNGLSGKIVYSQNNADIDPATALTLVTSTIKYKSFTENIRNVLFVSDEKLIWITAASTALVSQVLLIDSDSDIYSTDYITFAWDKAFAVYSDRISMFQNIGGNVVSMYLTVSLTNNMISANAPQELRVKAACSCLAVKVTGMSCFQSDMSCIFTFSSVGSDCTKAV